ncbi:Probable receptor-like protein kinase At1g11050 [Linum perenne]
MAMAMAITFPIFPLFSLFLAITTIPLPTSSAPSPPPVLPRCPFDLSYVRTIPWDTSLCQLADGRHCCRTLLNLFGIGIALHLRDTSLFQLPDSDVSSACLSDFNAQLTDISIDPSFVPRCFNDPNHFVSNVSSCAGIVTVSDWIQRVGILTPLHVSCRGDVSSGTSCSSCLDAGLKVSSQLTGIRRNSSSKCFSFTCLYAVAMVNELGPLDAKTSGCILAIPLVNPSNGKNNGMVLGLILGGVSGGVALLIAAGLVVILYRKRRRRRKNVEASHAQFVDGFKSAMLPISGTKWFKWSDLEKATNKFSKRNFLGKGAYGVVYKGVLSDGSLVAVKELQDLDSLRDEDFLNEVEIISKIRHRNLLSLQGCCVTSDELRGQRRFLVYDYMSNGSLGDHLGSDHTRNQLTWPQRKNIILDVAKALVYLHHGIKPAVYHRDIKANNILLDTKMKAKVADFGLAKQNSEGESHLTTRVAGTHGYLAPEYALYGQLTDKSDVYSFGIVVLEVVSGRKVIDTSSSSYLLIADWAWMVLKSGKMEDIFDEAIREQGPKGVMERFVHVGMLCAHVKVGVRPTIVDALKMLEGDIDIPELPDRPLPHSHDSFRQSTKASYSIILIDKLLAKFSYAESLSRVELEMAIRQIAELEFKLNELQEANDELGQSLENMKEEKAEVKLSLERMTAEKAQVERWLGEMEAENGEVESSLERMIAEKAQMGRSLEEMEEEKTQVETSLIRSEDYKKASESRLRKVELELEEVQTRLSSTEESKQDIKFQSVGLEAECRALSAEVVNSESELDQERTLALAAGKLAECQNTILPLGNQLKSLATIEDLLIDTDSSIPEIEISVGNSSLSPRCSGELWKLHSNGTYSPKLDSSSSRVAVGSPSASPIKHGRSSPSSSSSTSSAVHNTRSDMNRNGFAIFFSRSKNGIQLEL